MFRLPYRRKILIRFYQRLNGSGPRVKMLLAAVLVVLSVGVATSATIVKPWSECLTMPEGSSAIHDMTEFTDPSDGVQKLAIAIGWEFGAPILLWNPLAQQLTTVFQAPLHMYAGKPYWRSLLPFKGRLYAGLGNKENFPRPGQTPTGQVWQYDGVKWSLVLSTALYNTYALGVYKNQLYAGVGSYGSQSGQLWTTADGTTWTMLKQFSADYVRSLAVFQNKLYIGLRQRADLWTYDGTTFVDIGPPPGFTQDKSQVKTLVVSPDGSLLYVGGIPAQIWTWNGSTYELSLDATATDGEIYKGTVYRGDIFFPTHARQNGGQSGNIYRFSNGTWTLEYSTPVNQAQLQVVRAFQGDLYAGGDGGNRQYGLIPPNLLRADYDR